MRSGKVSGQQRGWYGAFDDGRDSSRRKGMFGRRLSQFKAKGDRLLFGKAASGGVARCLPVSRCRVFSDAQRRAWRQESIT